MEKYEILYKMDPGVYGNILFVKNRRDGREYTMKRVEFLDEGEANKALKEARCLLEMQHPRVTSYWEIFIMWDRKISSIVLCLVMECSYMRNLSATIKAHRDRRKHVDEKAIRRWLGSMVDALAYLHKQNIIHRNLKPSNILLKQDLSFQVSDFQVHSMADDELKLKIRIKESMKIWMAPETLEQWKWSEKSDVWSLGCILLEMLTCHKLDEKDAVSLLQKIRQDSEHLETFLQTLDRPPALCCLLKWMLQRNPHHRATIFELVSVPYVKECLILCDSPLSGLKKKLLPGVTGAPCEAGIEQVLEFMKKYNDIEEAQILAMNYLLKADQDMFSLISDVLEAVTSAMKSNVNCVEVQLRACRILQLLFVAVLEHSMEEEWMSSEKVINTVLDVVRTHSTNQELLALALNVLMILSGNEVSAGKIGKAGGIPELLKAMRTFIHNRDICMSCCGALWSLMLNGKIIIIKISQRALLTVCSAGEVYLQDEVLMESVCSALWSLILQGTLTKEHCEAAALLLLDALRTHTDRLGVVKNACLALASLVRISELAAFRVLLPPAGTNGLQVVAEVYHYHTDDTEVVENICSLFYEMVQYDEVVPELISFKEMIKQIQIKFASNEEIVVMAKSALSKMQN
ncbi:serine/threonine kinase-like domain-containing protein STKLD1 isoform X1 [Acipenser oxyrinchus oxyrinchus]|uniref:Serine/threonine kinase-like domain-containing protein STKLD1 n=1 Tax=Acipenser oxyrinchus oxyrinchus TaxID=40147 RepID=A0AAD8CHK4_ACIOX|nr:serine/threonine kinase-like domain-containing protein STKLD1 isoform X1 [Acipenser oxyrinchus oxyrinchus]